MDKKILFITAFPPSENAAAEKNTKIMLRDLGGHYDVDLVYFKDADKKEYEPELPTIKVINVVPNSKEFKIKNAIRHPLTHPIFTVRFNKRLLIKLQNAVEQNKYAAIIFDHSQTLNYARYIQFEGPKILICHDVEAQRFERTSNKLMAWFCKKSESRMLATKNATVFAFCQKDVDLIKEYYHIDAHVTLDYIDARIVSYTPDKITDEYVMFGNWTRKDNYEGALWLLNGLSSYLKERIVINIIGKKFPAEQVIVDNDKIRINYLGFVDNPYPIIANSRAMLCPLFTGAGIKVKVIESLASGTPVLGTDIAFEGFSENYNKYMIRCNDLESYAREMKLLNFELPDRMNFKESFINDYSALTIPSWLNENI